MNNIEFKDHFGTHANEYSKYRPQYPDELIKYISSLAYKNDLAWDCAAGSGQAAIGLSMYFKKVIASDASAKQIENAIPDPKISYKIFPAEKTDLETNSVDLVTVAQALHWLKIYKFFNEAKRVMKPTGIIAIWYYKLPVITTAIDKLIQKLYTKIVGKYWPPERQLIDDDYASLPFPFKRLYSPVFKMTSRWSYEELIGYLSTWSAVQKYKTDKRRDPVELIAKDLIDEFGEVDNIFEINWPLKVFVGKNLAD